MAVPALNDTSRSDTVLELARVSKTFRQVQRAPGIVQSLVRLVRPEVRLVHALSDVTMSVARGEVVAYAGPNGAGKSTTIKMLSGLLSPDAGSVRVLGMDPVRQRMRAVSRLGVVFGQRTELWWDQPVSASFEWKRVVWDIPDERYHRMRAALTERLGLDEFLGSLARELSLGQRMRADLALALLPEPDVLFLDEPTIGVDVLAKRHILEFVREMNRDRGATVLLTSHDISDLEYLAGRIVLIDRGRIAFDGDFDRLRRESGDRRRLLLETGGLSAPSLAGATLVESDGNRHEYVFDAARVAIPDLLAQAARQADVRDVETHRAPIDDVIAGIYGRWQSAAAGQDG